MDWQCRWGKYCKIQQREQEEPPVCLAEASHNPTKEAASLHANASLLLRNFCISQEAHLNILWVRLGIAQKIPPAAQFRTCSDPGDQRHLYRVHFLRSFYRISDTRVVKWLRNTSVVVSELNAFITGQSWVTFLSFNLS